MRNFGDKRRYMLVDGNALIHRGFHAIPNLSTQSGEPTNAVYGFTAILLRAIKDIKPTHIAMTFDLAGPTFRHDQYKEYKATRVKAADELYAQIPRCKEVVAALGIPIFEHRGFEADDMLGTLAENLCKENHDHDHFEIIIVTGDLDTLQLVNDKVKVYTLRKGLTDVVIYDRAAIWQRYGIAPEEMVDFKAIKGDPSDNIKGIKGIGEKGALDLIKKYHSIAGIYKNLNEIKERTRKLFEQQKKDLQLSYELSKIVRDVPGNYQLKHYDFTDIDYQKIVRLFQELEFKSLVGKLPKPQGTLFLTARERSSENKKTTNDSPGAINQTAIIRHNPNYQLINSAPKLAELVKNLAKQQEIAFDTETAGLSALEFPLIGVSISFEPGKAYYVPAAFFSAELKHIFENDKIAKIAHNIKYDFLAMKQFGVNVENLSFDTMLASYLLAPGSRSHDLDTLTFNEFGYQMQPITDLIGKGKDQISLKDVAVEKVAFYSCEDVDYTFRLKHLLAPRLKKEGLEKVFFDIEMPLVQVLAEMEENGILLDTALYKQLEKRVTKQLLELEKGIYKLAGREFNINSPSQLKVVLFEELQIPVSVEGMFIKKTKTGFSTAASELEKMRGMHPIIDKILEYRELAKLQSTYIKALPEFVSKRDGRLHTSYNQTIAATGRLSSVDPNLQNIPVGSTGVAAEIRKGFLADRGYKLLSVDYSQIELRVVAHLSGDKVLTKIFEDDMDVHAATAMQLYGIADPKKITKEMRRDAKTINFGVLYGVSSFGLSERVDMSRAEAAQFIKKYFEVFSGVDKFLKEIVASARKKGCVENELGRKRYFPEINSSQFQVRAAAERAAINMPLQSLAADILKIAMKNIAAEMDIQSEEIKMLLQVHDELVFEVREDLIPQYAQKIKKIMQDAYKLKVPLIAQSSVGDNWGAMQSLA